MVLVFVCGVQSLHEEALSMRQPNQRILRSLLPCRFSGTTEEVRGKLVSISLKMKGRS
jgi:hypothetical protein